MASFQKTVLDNGFLDETDDESSLNIDIDGWYLEATELESDETIMSLENPMEQEASLRQASPVYQNVLSMMCNSYIADESLYSSHTTIPWLATTTLNSNSEIETSSRPVELTQVSDISSTRLQPPPACCPKVINMKKLVSKMAKKIINKASKKSKVNEPPAAAATQQPASNKIVFVPGLRSRFNASIQQQQSFMLHHQQFKIAGDIMQYYV